MRNPVLLSRRPIGTGYPPFIVAELSGNHLGSLDRALHLVEVASKCGADAVKLQTYTADTLTIVHEAPEFTLGPGSPWAGRSLHDLYDEAHTPWDWHEKLFAKALEVGITMFSSPFDDTAVDLLETLGTPAYKIASFEAIDLPLVERVAATGKPVIISTGLCSREEIRDAVAAARLMGNDQIILLHTVSAYPARPENANLLTIDDLRERFDVLVGLSDHTPGTVVPVAGVALGACVIEKHLTVARSDGGPDAAFSLEPEEFTDLVKACKTAWNALGEINYDLTEDEMHSLIFRRSLYVISDISAGESLSRDNVRSIRPGYGLPPKHLPDVLGRHAVRDISRGTPLSWDLIS